MPFEQLSDIEAREIVPGYRARFLHSGAMTFAHWEVDAGAALPDHEHPHEQVAHVLEGRFELTLDGETRVLDSGTVAVIPGGTRHAGRAVTDCRLLDVFHPVREDYR